MIKKGKQVEILCGKDKGKKGEVIEILRTENKVKVKGINFVKKHENSSKVIKNLSNVRVFRYIIFTVWALLALNSFSIQPQISSDQPIEFDGNTKTMVARGEATFIHENLTVIADEIRYDQNKRIAEAHGNVRVTYGNIRHVSEDLVYDVFEKRLKSGPFRMGSPPYYAVGEGLDNVSPLLYRQIESHRQTGHELSIIVPSATQ